MSPLSGSTALAGYLASCDFVRFARRKEVHYFDSPASQCEGTLSYLGWFAGAPAGAAPPFVTAEATPFYLASPHAGVTMAAQLPRRSSLVAVLRERGRGVAVSPAGGGCLGEERERTVGGWRETASGERLAHPAGPRGTDREPTPWEATGRGSEISRAPY